MTRLENKEIDLSNISIGQIKLDKKCYNFYFVYPLGHLPVQKFLTFKKKLSMSYISIALKY